MSGINPIVEGVTGLAVRAASSLNATAAARATEEANANAAARAATEESARAETSRRLAEQSNAQAAFRVRQQDLIDSAGATRKVKLMAIFSRDIVSGNAEASRAPSVLFDVTPEITESHTASYTHLGEMMQPSEISLYMGSQGRVININAKFVSRTVDEAAANVRKIQLLKSWTKPDKSQIGTFEELASAGSQSAFPYGTPAVLALYAYGNRLNGVTVVMETLTITYPDDVDYITTGDSATSPTSIPIICNVTIGLKEVHSIEDVESFSIEAYRAGSLAGW